MEEIQEYPKMLYLHPVDKTLEHKYVVVINEEEAKAAFDLGYKVEPHIPQLPPGKQFEGKEYEGTPVEAVGSGSERWYGEGPDWTQTVGAGLTDNTDYHDEANREGLDEVPPPSEEHAA